MFANEVQPTDIIILVYDNLIKLEFGMIEKNESLVGLAPFQQGATTTNVILDSSLIVATKKTSYDIKLVDLGEYVQVYMYEKKQVHNTPKEQDIDLQLKKIKVTSMIEDTKNNNKKSKLFNNIELKNIIRSKLECQRLAKANISDWETFITLTFKENEIDVQKANKRFKYFVDKVRRIKKDFKYLCITEFQKRGAVHYHLLTNIKINDTSLIYSQEDNEKYKHIKYWLDGFTSVEPMKGDPKKIIGYIAKYMTKDIDNRLFNRHRYFYSRNLNKPKESYINISNEKEKDFYTKKIQDKELIYQNEYVNTYDNTKVIFLELSAIHKNYTITSNKKE